MIVPWWATSLFFVAAVVMDIFAIVAGASSTNTCLGVTWPVWSSATVLALLAWFATYPRKRGGGVTP